MAALKSGVPGLDRALGGGFLEGDNIIVENSVGAPPNALVDQFLRGAVERDEDVFYVSFDASSAAMSKRLEKYKGRVVLVDCFSHGRGRQGQTNPVESAPVVVQDPAYPAEFLQVLKGLRRTGQRRTIVVDSLNGMAMLWGDERRVAEFYASVCPALFDAGDLALWILHEGVQTPKFHAQIGHIAQVILRLGRDEGARTLTVERAIGRANAEVGVRQPLKESDSGVSLTRRGA